MFEYYFLVFVFSCFFFLFFNAGLLVAGKEVELGVVGCIQVGMTVGVS